MIYMLTYAFLVIHHDVTRNYGAKVVIKIGTHKHVLWVPFVFYIIADIFLIVVHF